MDPTEDKTILLDHKHIYARGTRLILSPHKPLRPYGSNLYPIPEGMTEEDMMLPREEETYSLRQQVFDRRNAPRKSKNYRHDKDAEMEVTIVDMIVGSPGPGYRPGSQKLLCRVSKAPSTSPSKQEQEMPSTGQYLFLKVYDALFWHKHLEITERNIKVTILADSAFSDEFGVYHFLHQKGLTGFDHRRTGYAAIASRFYGGWKTSVTSLSDEFSKKSRQVAILALEYVDGVSLAYLFKASGPSQRTVTLYQDKPPTRSFHTNQDQRMQIVAQLLNGIVSQEYLGLDGAELHPEKVIITMKSLDKYLSKPRAVLVGYRQAILDKLRTEPAQAWAEFDKKLHPITRFSWEILEDFEGWIPAKWKPPEDDPDDTPDLDYWFVTTFGTIKRTNPDYAAFTRRKPRAVAMPEETSTASGNTGAEMKEEP
ncbi:hypothetical protein CGRA01v4_13147 [Colletotrichum graminicola]|uniref:Uncharacterized protein n=1 Tax=Colletotrichum graminicola (strain M1.001 / M2 / FGSC 10212) TaxID=645133 RepID=E3QM78_COLGM|nr:uncharacterized protein GLRG_07110 [Colletotrichum graminicola M1.001]EFQ31966.1 hypothetical protein GLRG_07110 [Colletotrichum graminicola M1.001]WDK21857.1 hypothetical protein CGRA01v4_13147 [Colletotrichum graminicola]